MHNQKIELVTVVLSIVLGVVLTVHKPWNIIFCARVIAFFTDSRLNRIISATAIILGIYIAAISIIATSVLGITKNMLEDKKDRELLQITFSGMMINTILVFFCVLFDIAEMWQCIFLMALLTIVFVSFVKFMHLIFLVFQANFNQLSIQISCEESEKEDFFTILKKIEKNTSDK